MSVVPENPTQGPLAAGDPLPSLPGWMLQKQDEPSPEYTDFHRVNGEVGKELQEPRVNISCQPGRDEVRNKNLNKFLFLPLKLWSRITLTIVTQARGQAACVAWFLYTLEDKPILSLYSQKIRLPLP